MQKNHEHTLPDIKQTIVLEAPIQKVWEKVSTAEGISAWFMQNDFEPKKARISCAITFRAITL